MKTVTITLPGTQAFVLREMLTFALDHVPNVLTPEERCAALKTRQLIETCLHDIHLVK